MTWPRFGILSLEFFPIDDQSLDTLEKRKIVFEKKKKAFLVVVFSFYLVFFSCEVGGGVSFLFDSGVIWID